MKRWELWLKKKDVLDRDFKDYEDREMIRKVGAALRIAKTHLDKAFHNLDFANFTLTHQDDINKRVSDETYYDWIIVISYYAMYHAAMALAFKHGYKATTHIATICVLCKECVGKSLDGEDIEKLSNTLELSELEIKEIGRAKERREKASYSGSISFEKHLADMTLGDARKFVNKVADILEG